MVRCLEERSLAMYEAFYGLREKPFHVTADPAFLYFSRHHQEAWSHLIYGIRQRLGFLLITGEVGTGKTTLAKALVNQLEDPTKTALILNPALTSTELLRAVLRDFGQDPKGNNRGQLLASVERFLLSLAQSGGVGVVIIDEAQALRRDVLEQVRLLTNVETPKQKLLQIVLLGQPELQTRLDTDLHLRALNQRIAIHYRISPLSEGEVGAYIEHRLQVAGGGNGNPTFTPEAIRRIALNCQGIPRRINLACDRLLLAGFVRETRWIDESMVQEETGFFAQPITSKEVNG